MEAEQRGTEKEQLLSGEIYSTKNLEIQLHLDSFANQMHDADNQERDCKFLPTNTRTARINKSLKSTFI